MPPTLARRAAAAFLLMTGAAMADPTTHTLPTPEGILAYLKDGTGPALVIVHGVGGHKEDWQGVMAAMADSHTVYAIDMLGFGGSSRDAPDLSMPAQAAALGALLDAEGIAQADLLGNSVGGWVTATFTAAHPDRVSRLIVADPAGFRAMFEGEPAVNFFPDDLAQMEQLLATVLTSDFAHTPEFAAGALAALGASGERTIVPRLFPGLVGSPRLEEVMPQITVPTHVIWGEADGLFPSALAPYIAGLTPGATWELIAGAGHFPQVDRPEAFIAAVKAALS